MPEATRAVAQARAHRAVAVGAPSVERVAGEVALAALVVVLVPPAA